MPTPNVPVNELTELALWMAAGLAGMVTAVLLARAPFFRGVMRRLGRTLPPPRNAYRARRPGRARSLPLLAEAIVGSSKATVAAVLGPPRSAVLASVAPAPTSTYWQADTWYYPLPPEGPVAMAVRFDEDFARSVEFIAAPRR